METLHDKEPDSIIINHMNLHNTRGCNKGTSVAECASLGLHTGSPGLNFWRGEAKDFSTLCLHFGVQRAAS